VNTRVARGPRSRLIPALLLAVSLVLALAPAGLAAPGAPNDEGDPSGLWVQPDGPMHGIEGLKHMETALVPGIYDAGLADRDLRVDTDAAVVMTRRLAREEGLFVGISAGANVAAALAVAEPPAVVVTVLCDGGARYLSDPLWEVS